MSNNHLLLLGDEAVALGAPRCRTERRFCLPGTPPAKSPNLSRKRKAIKAADKTGSAASLLYIAIGAPTKKLQWKKP